ncbi:type II secretion system F family protein [Alloalcanivorax xenomutans]|jgi:tight adherence protein B|uniref:type II secretion system F family protein n=1 Tax=Alloalcanivorax xenomutans TaxID=1094342 RepID=UPI001F415C2B|nr:type II secretion system F family protein [Alloalcanivorax xenomutans]MCE7523033.1 type II secretion system F family protein [Alloalcanivorax xenomutans]
MSTFNWLVASQILAFIALAVVALQWLWFNLREQRQIKEAVERRLALGSESGAAPPMEQVLIGKLERLLVPAGIRLSDSQLILVGVFLIALVFAVFVVKGMVAALVALVLTVMALLLYWKFRFEQQRRRINEELPGIMETALRYMDAGRSLEQSLVESFREAHPVFDPLAFRLRSAVEAGRDYTSLFEDFSSLYRIPSLILVSIALRTSARFGSSIRPVMQQVASSLRSQQELRREFMAATSETRFTAGAFAIIPMGMAAYMILMNDSYSEILIKTSTGNTMLVVAGALQGMGILVILKMIQGVGRV